MVPVTCEYCGVEFLRNIAYVNRGRKRGWGTFCSLSHSKLANPSFNDETLRPLTERLWLKVRKGDGCWTFTGARNGYGYGVLIETVDGQRHERLAHRVAWSEANGPIPAGMVICHHCDNPPCVRPDHLFLGTHADNMADMIAKGRAGWQKTA